MSKRFVVYIIWCYRSFTNKLSQFHYIKEEVLNSKAVTDIGFANAERRFSDHDIYKKEGIPSVKGIL